MEEKNGDIDERRDSEPLTIRHNKSYQRRPLSNRTSDNYQVSLTVVCSGLYVDVDLIRRAIKVIDGVSQYPCSMVIHVIDQSVVGLNTCHPR
jgi:hypothetical protein